MLDVLWLGVGLALLAGGAEWLVRAAAGLARALGIRPLVVGLTVVAFGTSAPELSVSLAASANGHPALALGNVVGSNVANLGLILAVAALIRPPTVDRSIIRRDAPLMLGCGVAVPLLLADGVIGRPEGVLLLLAGGGFVGLLLRTARGRPATVVAAMERDAETLGAPAVHGRLRLAVVAAVGIVGLVVGGELFVRGASGVARALGVSERIVGLTIVAVGTSAPELATSVVAALRGHSDIAVGNVVGSNVFNVLFVLGGAAVVRPIPGEVRAQALEMSALVAFSLLGTWFLRDHRRILRREGALLLALYVAFLAALILGGGWLCG